MYLPASNIHACSPTVNEASVVFEHWSSENLLRTIDWSFLEGDGGARGLIRDDHGPVLAILLPAAAIDVVNSSELDRLIRLT